MIAEPTSPGADAFRRLRMNLEFACIGKPSQVMMLTSAMPQEGKSTTLANLGVAMALAGKNVAIVDLDLHRPTQGGFFRLGEDRPGLTSVVLGHVGLDEALVDVPLDPLSRNGNGRLAPRPTALGLQALRPPARCSSCRRARCRPTPASSSGSTAVGRVIAAASGARRHRPARLAAAARGRRRTHDRRLHRRDRRRRALGRRAPPDRK